MERQNIVREFFALFQNDLFIIPFKVVLTTVPLWLPIVLTVVVIKMWIRYRQRKYIDGMDYVLLEVLLPAEITKSPLAMEVVLNGLHFGSGETTWVKRYVQGSVRPWWSFELASIEGQVHFYIWTRASLRNMVEALVYSQYPEVEIVEAEDYSRNIDFKLGETSVWGLDFKLNREDAYPIKTYIDYGLDKDVKEEVKVDPLVAILEFLGTIGPGEQVWYQILFRQTRAERREKGKWFKRIGWKDEAEALVKKLRDEATPTFGPDKTPGFPNMTPGQIETLKAIERSVGKHGFDCGVRGIYVAEKDKFIGARIPSLIYSFKQFSSNSLNGFTGARWLWIFDYPWQDYKEIRQNRARRRIMDAYRRRAWFHFPYRTPSYVLNVEELATMYHFPGAVAQTPNLQRIQSKRSDAPTNLPK